MGVYKPQNQSVIGGDLLALRDSGNQRVISGTDDEVTALKGVFLLSHVSSSAGVTIYDGDDNQIASGVLSFTSDKLPIRCDHGIRFDGDVIMAVGHLLENVLPE